MMFLAAHHIMMMIYRTFGQFFASMVGGVFVEIMPDTGWRYMLGLVAIPGISMFWGFLSPPESPRWLEAEHILKSMRESDQDALDELADSVQTVETRNQQSDDVATSCEGQELIPVGAAAGIPVGDAMAGFGWKVGFIC